MSKTAEQAWRNYCKKWVDCNPEGASLMAISDYKQVLRQAIEKRLMVYEELRGKELQGTIPYWAGCLVMDENKMFLQLLDTVTPTKE